MTKFFERYRVRLHANWFKVAACIVFLAFTPFKTRADSVAAGDVGPAFTEAGAHVLAGALETTTVEPSSGVLRSSVAIDIPSSRGGAQPSLGLSYSSAAGIREAGMGWGLNLPVIERRAPIGGPPDYFDPPVLDGQPPAYPNYQWNTLTRFTFSGEPLVPVCQFQSASYPCDSIGDADALPGWLKKGWVYFRLEHDFTAARFFWSPDRQTWRVQMRGGEILELGKPIVQPIEGAADDEAIDTDNRLSNVPGILLHNTFRWNISRRFDDANDTRNVVIYRWNKPGNSPRGYLSDIYYTPAAVDAPNEAPLADFAHHVRLTWQRLSKIRGAQPPIWKLAGDYSLLRIDVASKGDAGVRAPRQLVRRYHLSYDYRGQLPFLTQFQMEGRCADPIEEAGEALPDATNCPLRPATTFRYSPMLANKVPGNVVVQPGLQVKPGHKTLDLIPVDINGDSLPDFIESEPPPTTVPVTYDPRLILIHNGTWHVPTQITNTGGLFSASGDTITGDFTSTGELGAWLYGQRTYSAAGVNGTVKAWTSVPHLTGGQWQWDSINGLVFVAQSILPTLMQTVKLIGDTNGDGLQDLLTFPDEHSPGYVPLTPPNLLPGLNLDDYTWPAWPGGNPPADWKTHPQIGSFVSQRKADGGLNWIPGNTCYGPSVADMEGEKWPDGSLALQLADMDGDSLGDIVAIGPTHVRYWPSDGRGHFTSCRGIGCLCSTTSSVPSNVSSPHGLAPGTSSRRLLLADLNGDGFSDLVSWDANGLRVAFNKDGLSFQDPPITIEGFWFGKNWAAAVADDAVKVSVADMNGNGINDLVITVRGEINSIDLHSIIPIIPAFAPDAYASRPDLLIEIDNGQGARTQIDYESTAELTSIALLQKKNWPEAMPQVMHVVQRLTMKTDVPDSKPIVTYYDYDDPSWDGWERRLRGFRKVTTYRGNGPQVVTTQTFFIPPCPNRFCGSTDDGFGRLNAVSGQLLTSETSDTVNPALSTNHYLSTTSYSYTVIEHLKAADGRVVRSSYASQIDTRLYDTANWQPGDGTGQQTIGFGRGPPIWTGTVPVRSPANVLLRTIVEQDSYGNVIKKVDQGRIHDDGTPIDLPRVSSVVMNPLRADWKFLPAKTVTEAFPGRQGISADQSRTKIYDYDKQGRVTTVSAILHGTLPLDRHHEDPAAAVAPQPPDRSYDTLAALVGYMYDNFNNVSRIESPPGSCTTIAYDTDFAQLPQQQALLTDSCVGARSLITEFTWDRGLQAQVMTRQPNGVASTSVYDAFGRLIEIHSPDSATGLPSDDATDTIQYLDAPGAAVQKVRVQSRTAPGKSSESWIYLDGFGQELLRLRQADRAAGDGGDWIASGLPVLNDSNLVTGLYAPWFYTGDPAAHPLTAPTTPSNSFVLDSFGRAIEAHGQDNALITKRIYQPLKITSQNSLGNAGSVEVDGHGMLIEQRSQADTGELVVDVDYLVGGEPARVSQYRSNGANVSPSVVRWMQYDSLGRLVLNAEPNSSKNFSADPHTATTMNGWRYAYNRSGQMVGTSDARGCGWNAHYDVLGRMVARDFSPCLRSQAAYTPPDLTTGAGTEAFYRYDTLEPGQPADTPTAAQFVIGRLASSFDRGTHTRYTYDARGQLIGLAKQPARPVDASGNWPGAVDLTQRYVSDWYRSTFSYDELGRKTLETTGAQASGLLDPAGASAISLQYSTRGILTRIGGSYGTLLAGATYDALDRPLALTLGDVANTTMTTSYNADGLPQRTQVARIPPSLWSQGASGYTPPTSGDLPSTQTVLQDLSFTYDSAGRLTRIGDGRAAAEWPTGAKPVSRSYQLDPLGRVSRIDYAYAGAVDASPAPAPAVGIPPSASPNRPVFQAFTFDGYNNIAQSSDDANALFERSIGKIERGPLTRGPHQLTAAADGQITARYDDSGNMVSLTVKRSACAEPSGRCTHRFDYDWDESGLLARARRWDYVTIPANEPTYPAVPASPPAAEQRYRYDAAGARVLRSSLSSTGSSRHTLWPLEMLRLNQTSYDAASATYLRSNDTEEIVLPKFAQISYRAGLPGASAQRVLLKVHDHLGSTTAVIDKTTGELAEQLSYLAYGGIDSDYRPPRWGGLAAHERFTGKESDDDVGLTYFGARYLFSNLNQWISADPAGVHGLGPDLNPYSYVGGKVAAYRDPHGLQPCIGREDCSGGGSDGGDDGGDDIGGFGGGSGGGGGGGSSGGGGGGVARFGKSPPPLPALPNAPGTGVPLWQALGNPSMWSSTVDPAVISGFNAGVSRNQEALVVTAAAGAIGLGALGALEGGLAIVSSGARTALANIGAAVLIRSAGPAEWITEIGLAEQGITLGGGYYALTRLDRANQIAGQLAAARGPGIAKSVTIAVTDLFHPSLPMRRVISTNNPKALEWLIENKHLVLEAGEKIVEITERVNGEFTHAEVNAVKWALDNGYKRGVFASSNKGCDQCLRKLVIGTSGAFAHDNPAWPFIDLIIRPLKFFDPFFEE